MVGRLIQQKQLSGIASPEHARQGRFQTLAAAERRQRQSDLIRAKLELRQSGAQKALIQRGIVQAQVRHDR